MAEDGVKEIGRALQLVTEAVQANTPLVFHCASGKDRTSQLAALILELAGVPDETIIEDYTLTELATPALLADWKTRNTGREPSWPGFGRAPSSVMKTYLTSLRTRYGSTENYVNQQLSLDAEELQNTLRTSLLESAPTA